MTDALAAEPGQRGRAGDGGVHARQGHFSTYLGINVAG